MSAFTIFLSIVSSFIIACNGQCGANFTGASYDLSPLTITSDDSIDWYKVTSTNWDYWFNVCELVQSYPDPICDDSPTEYCASFDNAGDCNKIIPKPISLAYAFQYDLQYDECYRMSSDNTGNFTPAITWSLIDQNDPGTLSFKIYIQSIDTQMITNTSAFGVAMVLHYGDYEEEWCEGGFLDLPESNRNLEVHFVCNSDINNFTESLDNAIITELEGDLEEACNAVIRLETSYGCPAECGINSDGILCNGQGSCGYDERQPIAKCFCYAGT